MKADISTREGLFAVMRQLAKEREEAKPRVAGLLARKELPWDEPIPEEWRTAGFVRELTKEASRTPENDPPRAVLLLQFAVAVSTAASHEAYPEILAASLLAEALICLGWIENYQGEFTSATKCLDTALKHLETSPALGFDRARIELNYGGVQALTGQYDQAFSSLARARESFEEFGDEARVASVKLAKSVAQHLQGDLRGACRTLEDLVNQTPAGENHTLATVFNNLAAVHAVFGNLPETFEYANRARTMYEALGLPSDKPDWSEARVLLQVGKTQDALSRLTQLRNTFQTRGLLESAALAGLDIVDALLTLELNDDAYRLTEDVIDELRLAEMNDHVVGAITYLRDLLPKKVNAKRAVRHVRAFVEAAQHNRSLLFSPLPE